MAFYTSGYEHFALFMMLTHSILIMLQWYKFIAHGIKLDRLSTVGTTIVFS